MPSYSVEHFRWGKPTGRKRHLVGIFNEVGGKEERLAGQTRGHGGGVTLQEQEEHLSKKSGGRVWFDRNPLVASKRYGGFMKGGDDRSQRPLITLFKNVINKDGQEVEGREG